MRFNDLLRTVLANIGEGTGATVTRWRQCVDLLAQYDVSGAQSANALDDAQRAAVLGMIAQMRPQIAVEQRIASVRELGSRLRSPGLVRLLADDHPSLVAAMMKHVRLTDEDWASIIPDLGPLGRSVLRRREDLGEQAQLVLRQFGPTDLSLPALVALEGEALIAAGVDAAGDAGLAEPAAEAGQAAMTEPEPGIEAPMTGEPPLVAADVGDAADAGDEASQIVQIVARIEKFNEIRFQRREDAPLAAEMARAAAAVTTTMAAATEPVNAFAFEADTDGIIRLTSGPLRSAAFGLSIGTPATDSRYGADGTALGAFRRRAAFENARFSVGEGALEGEWRISAEPRFDRLSGRFTGYVGTARREYSHEGLVRAGAADQTAWSGLSAAGTRQLIHELRTPLNAIQGYAEMIEAQLLGPVSDAYRQMASQILADARTLLGTFDDLDMASRIERGDTAARPERMDLAALTRAIAAGFGPQLNARIDLHADAALPAIGGDPAQVERMLAHLLRAGCAALAEDERLTLHLAGEGAGLRLAMSRPAALHAVSDQDLLDHGYLVDQKLRDAPPLGLAFTLKLVRGIAHHLGGRLDITAEAFILALPAADQQDGGQESLR